MKVDLHVPDKELGAWFRGSYFHLERDDDDRWYMLAYNGDGRISCDGWIADSEDMNERQAMTEACKGALIEPPKRWPRQLVANEVLIEQDLADEDADG